MKLKAILTTCFLTLILCSCGNNQKAPKLSLEEIKEKADWMLLYKKAYDLKNPNDDNGIPEIAGISVQTETVDGNTKRDLIFYYADGTTDQISVALIFTYAELKSLGNVEIAKRFGPEYIDKIELLDKDSIYLTLETGNSIVINIEEFSFTYTYKGKEIYYPMDTIAFAEKMGLPPRP